MPGLKAGVAMVAFLDGTVLHERFGCLELVLVVGKNPAQTPGNFPGPMMFIMFLFIIIWNSTALGISGPHFIGPAIDILQVFDGKIMGNNGPVRRQWVEFQVKFDHHAEEPGPEPLAAQNRSAFSVPLAWTSSPSAVTMSMPRMLWQAMPVFRPFQP